MSDRTIQDVVMASIQAEDAGAIIDWKTTCLQLVQATQIQFTEMQGKIDELTQDNMQDEPEDTHE